jgi:UDP-N-acetylmuramate--alanine ligase
MGVLPLSLDQTCIHMVGVKGTGMAALAELLSSQGAMITGSDVPDVFYTDEILKAAGVTVLPGFSAEHLPDSAQAVIYSVAYSPKTNVELLAAQSRGIPIASYNEALGEFSSRLPSVGIAGVHGKTTTTMMIAAIVAHLGLPGSVLAGGATLGGDRRATVSTGDRFFVAETCEYRRSFLSFRPRLMVITSVEADHLDYYRDAHDVEHAFLEYARLLPVDGELIYCADDQGASRVAARIASERPELTISSYGFSAAGEGRISGRRQEAGASRFRLADDELVLHVPGAHSVLNATAAILVCRRLAAWSDVESDTERFSQGVRAALDRFSGSRRRSEIIGVVDDIVVVDDYAHHPTAIRATLEGFRSFYSGRRIVLDFMSHTYSRTLALRDQFGEALALADIVILHDIYASAREENPGGIDGTVLVAATREALKRRDAAGEVYYVPNLDEGAPLVAGIVRRGDLFVTMGAGDNWRVGQALLSHLKHSGVTQ